MGQPLPSKRKFTPREQDVLLLICEGKTNREIGKALRISDKTVKNHVGKMLTTVNVSNRTQLVIYAFREGLV